MDRRPCWLPVESRAGPVRRKGGVARIDTPRFVQPECAGEFVDSPGPGGAPVSGASWWISHPYSTVLWERASVDEVIDRVESEGGDARAKLRRLSALAASSDEPLRIDLAVRDWARREQTVAERLRRIDNRRMEYLCSLFGSFCTNEDDV